MGIRVVCGFPNEAGKSVLLTFPRSGSSNPGFQAEVDAILRQFREAPETLEPVERDALLDRIQKGEVILLDVRPAEEYRAAHLPFAVSAPLKDLDSLLAKLRRRKPIVAYCRGPYCVLAKEAVRLLRAKGFRAVRLEDGVPEWRAQGLPVVVGEGSR